VTLPIADHTVFIAWTEWTLTVALLWWQHYNYRFPVVSPQVDSTRSVYPVDGSSHGQFNTGRFIPEREKQLAHVPVEDVLDAFEELATDMPQHQGIDELLTYFEHTYIRGRRLPGRGHNNKSALFLPASWNKREYATEGIARTTNNIWEGWHNSLLLCNHPSMWTFFDGIMKEIAMQTASFLQATAGSQRAPKKK